MSVSRRAGSGGRMIDRRLWRFAGRELDESRWLLTVEGEPVELEAKPCQLLLELLRHPGEVLTKDELLEAVWPETLVVESSLATAISKLRRALRDDDQSLIVTAPKIGYRLAAAVDVLKAPPRPDTDFGLEAGSAAPGRPQWRLMRVLGQSRANQVWLCVHDKTSEQRVFKFANDVAYLGNLKREVAISRLIVSSLGQRGDFAPVLEWNFQTQPFWLESVYRGEDLVSWAQAHGPLSETPLDRRLDILAQACQSVADAHGLGVLHQDLKPANIVISRGEDGDWRTAVVDFGSADVDLARLEAMRITRDGFQSLSGSSSPKVGTPFYLAPELLAGRGPSTGSDIYALGVMLYQLVIGDLGRPLAPGWEREVDDPLLRQDIAEAASGDPKLRLSSAAELARRLRTLPQRRAEHTANAAQARREAELEKALLRARARRPWVLVAAGVLVAGLAVSSALFWEARRERDEALRQGEIAREINSFLSNDLLARSNPFKSGKADESFTSAVGEAAANIDRRFPGEPQVAAALHHTIAQALDRRGQWPTAAHEYERAVVLWRAVEGAASSHAHIAALQEAMMLARTYAGSGPDRAKALLARETQSLAGAGDLGPEIPVWLASARGMIALVGNDARQAAHQFGLAAAGAEAHPDKFDATSRLTFLQREAFAYIRLGDGAKAEALFRRLQTGYAALEGPDGPNGLMVRLNLIQALMIEGQHDRAIKEADALYPKMAAALGPEHELTLQLLSTRAQSEGALERWDAAIADTRMVHAAAIKTIGPRSFFAIASLTDGATAKCRSGRVGEGLADAAEAHAQAHPAFAGSALENAVDFTWANCLILSNRLGEAAPLLAGIKPAAVAQLAGDPDWGANLDIAEAQIALAKGQTALARERLASAAGAMRKPAAEPYQVRLYQKLRTRAGLA
jgi:DNA-binding winged helix-turn-helix (wHTH) protein